MTSNIFPSSRKYLVSQEDVLDVITELILHALKWNLSLSKLELLHNQFEYIFKSINIAAFL